MKQYIRATNESYDLAVELQADGELAQRYRSMAENFRLGFHTDLLARGNMNRWFNGLGIDPTTDPNIGINERVYNLIYERNYRIPDLRVWQLHDRGYFVEEGPANAADQRHRILEPSENSGYRQPLRAQSRTCHTLLPIRN